jgi:hypothetical protein
MIIDNTKPIITFDFDGTLSSNEVQQLYHQVKDKANIFILTKRYDCLHKHLWKDNPTNDEVWEVVSKLNIPKENVFFTNFKYKHEFLKDTFVLLHLDDDWNEIDYINTHTSTKGICTSETNWKKKFLTYIETWKQQLEY